MKLGVRAHDYGRMTIAEMAETLYKEGFQAAQLVLPKVFSGINSFDDIKDFHLEEIHSTFSQYKIDIPVFGCYMDLGNPDREIRDAAVSTFKTCLTYARTVGAKVVGTETARAILSEEQKKVWYPYMVDSIFRLVEAAQEINMQIAIEPVYCHPLENLDATIDIIERVNAPEYLRLIFDPANVLRRPQTDNQDCFWSEWLHEVGDCIDIIHVKDFVWDNQGGQQPQPLGQGVMNYDIIRKWLRSQSREIYLIREELNPAFASNDLQYMKEFVIQ